MVWGVLHNQLFPVLPTAILGEEGAVYLQWGRGREILGHVNEDGFVPSCAVLLLELYGDVAAFDGLPVEVASSILRFIENS